MSSENKTIGANVPINYIAEMDELIQEGKYSSRAEFLRIAVNKLVEEEIKYEILGERFNFCSPWMNLTK